MTGSYKFKIIDDLDDFHTRWSRRFRERQIPVTAYHFPHERAGGPRHDHDYIEIQLCAGGTGWQESALGDRPFREGDAFVLHPGAWHRHHDNDDVDSYVCGFLEDLLHHELLWTLDNPRLNRLLWRASTQDHNGIVAIHLDPPALARCVAHFEALVAIGESEDPETNPDRLGHLILILSCLAQGMEPLRDEDRNGSGRGADVSAASGVVHVAVKRSVALVNENLAEPWTASELARRLNIDLSYLGRLFQAALGVSPMQYIAQARAKRAAHLLLRTPMPIADIAEDVGWPDPNYFARRFRAHFGITASEYRTRHLSPQS
ncbi:AraC family transcriptional regulator [Opitutaceae bacterium TAV5]|nr:AraC family transcriptional regulator [Opitutaceae bacterium TAV5]